jgi:hypothetical protein
MNEKCFAMRKKGVCGALTVKSCSGYEKCPFYKPIWKRLRDQETANARLCALPEEEQQMIADKYHNGSMPWRGDRE